MEKKNEKVIDTLRELGEFVKDANLGYKKAADESKDNDVKDFCNEQSSLRANFLSEINSAIATLGGETKHTGTIKGALYRQYMDVKTAVTGNDAEEILSSCIFGEEWAIKAYHNALENQDLPVEIRSVIEKQNQICNQTLGKLKTMKNLHHH